MNQASDLTAQMKTLASSSEVGAYQTLVQMLLESPIPPTQLLGNLSLFLTRSSLSQILFLSNLYEQILSVHGVVMEFGVRWGRNLSLFTSLRNIFEPHNYGRRVIGFDTFEGFPVLSEKDGQNEAIQVGRLSVSARHEEWLAKLLQTQESLAPRGHLQKFSLIKGDVEQTLSKYLADHPETIIALAYFDMDLYRPTRAALEAVLPYLVKGSILGFDELCLEEYPGETTAFREVVGRLNGRLRRSPLSGHQSYIVIE